MNKILLMTMCIVGMVSASCNSATEKDKEKKQNNQTDSTNVNELIILTDAQIENVGIEIGNPSLENISGVISLHGSIVSAPENNVSLSFPVGGYIRSTHVLLGKPVRRGQILATIEDLSIIQLQQDYLSAKSNKTLAERELNRQQELNASKATSERAFEQAQNALEKENILVSALAEKLQLIGIDHNTLSASTIKREAVVRAPINGFISKINVSIGKYTAPTDVLFEIIDPLNIYLSLKVFEKDLDKIKIGQKISASTPTDGELKYEARIVSISRNFDVDRMAEILCKFNTTDASLIPGMFMSSEVSIQDVESIVVPEDAIVRWQNKHYIFLEQSKGKFNRIEVRIGVQRDHKQQIINSNITENSNVVIKNAFALLMKSENSEM
ncbi:efflux RND transporter periplasmic adaptor subunit [Sphingobacterium sp. lm-10]|uniref:efflux RND transporter periplasmic adaptor subunit n=1 Tax=Sphingobacterium sp. lm-10 TaxID=2944904 RepID=UPI0020228C87|nr:efflux RND transporter periplasmic adaptor subunit [Sphingobacterium sp. lm-10]MCL7987564.1 efflux RND transporter periplasmic adaptor subunit [Sphingobacterium sp. lm-10]